MCGFLPDLCTWWDSVVLWWNGTLAIFRAIHAIWPALLVSHLVAYLIGWKFGWKGLLVVLTLGVGLLLLRGNKPAPEPDWETGEPIVRRQPVRKRKTLMDWLSERRG